MPNEPIFGELVKVELEACLDAPIARYFDAQLDKDPDVLAQLLADKRNPNTRRAYEKDLKDFFLKMTLVPPTGDSVLEFLHLQREQAVMPTMPVSSTTLPSVFFCKRLVAVTSSFIAYCWSILLRWILYGDRRKWMTAKIPASVIRSTLS